METVSGWTCPPYAAARAAVLADELGVQPATAAVLARRGLADAASARAFLAGDERSDPAELPGVSEAVAVVLRHVRRGSRVAVFGDYDVDGVCSTAIAVGALRALGADAVWRLPSRDEGYGLSLDAVRELRGAGADLLVTVDCGVGAVEEVALARGLGMDVVVTDHHRPGGELPDCPVVHPGLGPGPSPELCAAGVALKLSEALRGAAGLDPAGAGEDLDLAGLATVCDMVPLLGENRRIAREGLAALARTRRPGLRALMRVAGLEPGELDSRAAGFRLGPRINAAGRLARADAALELLLTDDEARAEQVARELDGLNHDRRETEQRILSAAESQAAAQVSAGAIVVAGEGWHPGVVGIVASRLVERHRRPCVAIALEGGRGRGSGRSIDAYDLHEGLAAAASHLLRFGGHRMAAGLEIEEGQVDALRGILARHAGERLAPEDLARVQEVDAVAPGGALTLDLAEELERLGPFGAGNPAPTLLVPAARVEHVTAMGEERAHARFSISSGGARARGVAFRTSQKALAETGAAPHDVAVGLERNRWNGTVEARVVLKSVCPTPAGTVHDLALQDFWADFERELSADPSLWWDPAPEVRTRTLRNRRGEGFAGVAGELLTSGEPVLLVVADVARRQAALEATVAGMAAAGLQVVSWAALAGRPALAADFEHLLVLDPPPVEEGLALLAALPGAGLAHLAWGPAEREFALGHWRSELGLRTPLADLWRTLDRAGSLEGESLAAALRGDGAYPRSGRGAGRLVRVLCELGLARYAPDARRCDRLGGARTELERSASARAYAARLEEAELWLRGAERPARAALAAVGG